MGWLAASLIAAGAAGWGAWRLWRIAAVGAAYKAKVLCSAAFVSGLEPDPASADEVSSEAYRILRLFRARVDRDAKTVTSSLFGLRPRTAVFRPGLGATLALGAVSLARAAAGPPLPSDPAREWPEGEGGAPAREREALRRVVDEAFAERDIRRLRRTRAVVVARDGRLVAERYAPGISRETPLPGWSMAKSVIGALVGAAVGLRRLSLEQAALLPCWRGAGDARARISLEDLLRMRSGLRWTESYSDPLSDVVRMLFAEADAAGFAAGKPLAEPPGTAWRYSSGTTNILSAVLREALGEGEYRDFPRRALFDPVGMGSATLEPDASGTFVGSSFMLATARDWARFGLLQLRDGVWDGRRLLPEGWVAFATRPTPQAPDGRFGAHWWLRCPEELGGSTPAAARLPRDAYYALGHEGQVLTVIPSRRLVVVRLGLTIDIRAWDHAAFLAALLAALED
ncbi:MAG: serine hydrolase [Elusimicrobia bacterium]|nr:serine hydrolase [Elusimicrobiota bacterium]